MFVDVHSWRFGIELKCPEALLDASVSSPAPFIQRDCVLGGQKQRNSGAVSVSDGRFYPFIKYGQVLMKGFHRSSL